LKGGGCYDVKAILEEVMLTTFASKVVGVLVLEITNLTKFNELLNY